MPKQPPDLIGSAEVCRLLDVHQTTVSRWVTQGRLRPASKFPGKNGAYVFHRGDVERLRGELAAENAS